MLQVKTICPELSVDEVAELMKDSRTVLIDVNFRRRWASGHLPGAINLDPNEYTADDLPANKLTTLVFYCNDTNSRASRYAAQKATRFGYTNVFTMPAGIRGWLAARKPAAAGR
jgi:rhodanese-related sulfurtransferase